MVKVSSLLFLLKKFRYLLCIYFLPLLVMFSSHTQATSQCYGSTANGRIENAEKLPLYGENFTSYSYVATSIGRTYVHSIVKDIMLLSYKALYSSDPKKVFKYAETGFEKGGKFSPHKTHQNGLSVDFFVPVINEEGKSVHLATHALNKLGYNIEFNQQGKFKDYKIDFVALRAHLLSLAKVAKEQGYSIKRVIFDPRLQPLLFSGKAGRRLKRTLRFNKRQAWVRHDEHYHVDFNVTCKKKA